MHLEAGQRRIEYADNSQRLFAAAQPMFIVFVQGVNHTGTQGIFLSIGYCFDFAVTFYAPYGFKVILVMNMRFRTRKNHGFMEGKPHAVFLQQHRSEEHTSELQSLMRISYAVFCLKKKTINKNTTT